MPVKARRKNRETGEIEQRTFTNEEWLERRDKVDDWVIDETKVPRTPNANAPTLDPQS